MAIFSIKRQISLMLLILLIKLCILNGNVYRLPVGLYNALKEANEKDLIVNIFHNFIYVNLSIGTPPQIIPFHIDINSQTFYVSKKFFNRTASSTYEQISKNETTYFHENAITGYNSKDILEINGIKKKINFIFETKHDKNNDVGCLGLMIPIKLSPDIYPVSRSLIQAGFINSSIWTLKFNKNLNILDMLYIEEEENDIIGEFIIGDDPHNYEENIIIYNESLYMKSNAVWSEKEINWDIIFDSIYLTVKDNQTNSNKDKYKKIYIYREKQVILNPDIGFFVGPTPFYHIIRLQFFEKYRNICYQYRIKNTLFRVLECKNTDFFNVSSFPNITFELNNITFTLTYKDLFLLDTNLNKYIFLILQEGYIDYWILGRIFFRKYQFTFNEHEKTIGYYIPFDSNKEVLGLDKNKIIEYIVYFLQIIFIFMIIIFVLYEIYTKCHSSKRKKRINELEEDNFSNENLLKEK